MPTIDLPAEVPNPVRYDHEDLLADLNFKVCWEIQGSQLGFVVTWEDKEDKEDKENHPDVFDQAMTSEGVHLTPTYMRGSFRQDGTLWTYQGKGFLSYHGIQALRRHTALLTYLYRTAYRLFTERMGAEVDQLKFK